MRRTAPRLTLLPILLLLAAPAAEARKARPDKPASPPVLRLDLLTAVREGLALNPEFMIQKVTPYRRSEEVAVEQAAFDRRVGAGIDLDWRRSDGAGGATTRTRSRGDNLEASLERPRVDGATDRLKLTLDGARSDGRPEARQVRLGYEFTHPLLRGGSREVNLAPLRLAANAALRSTYELRGLALSLAARIANAYFDLHSARARIALYRESLEIAKRELEELNVRVKVGQSSENDTALAEAEVARRREFLIDAEATAVDRRLQLLRLMGRPADDWQYDIEPSEPLPEPAARVPDPGETVARALARRPELPQARLALEAGELELVRTADGLLPKLDFFLSLGKSGYAAQFDGFGDKAFDARAALTLTDTPDRRAARARHRIAGYTVAERKLAIANLEAAIRLEALQARNELIRALAQVKATASTLRFRTQALAAEAERAKVGRSTPFAVAQAARDRLESEVSALEARVAAAKAMILLEQRQGTLLERFGVEVE